MLVTVNSEVIVSYSIQILLFKISVYCKHYLSNIKLCHTTLLLYTRIILDLTFTSDSNLLISLYVHITLSQLDCKTLVSLSLPLTCCTVQRAFKVGNHFNTQQARFLINTFGIVQEISSVPYTVCSSGKRGNIL